MVAERHIVVTALRYRMAAAIHIDIVESGSGGEQSNEVDDLAEIISAAVHKALMDTKRFRTTDIKAVVDAPQ